MNILFLSDRERFWRNWYGAIRELSGRGHKCSCLTAPGKKWAQLDEAIARLNDLGVAGLYAWDGRCDLRTWYVQTLWSQAWDAICLCPEHVTPMRWTRWLLHPPDPKPRPAPPVIAMEHGLAQGPYRGQGRYCDHFLCWGVIGRDLMAGAEPKLHTTGTTRFDQYRAGDAVDAGFVLAIASSPHDETGTFPGRGWLDRARAAAGARPLVVKVHPNDDQFVPPADTASLRWLRACDPPREALRTCHAVYLDYPSSCLIEALSYGKRLILDGWVKEVFASKTLGDALLPGDAAGRIADKILEIAQEAGA